MTQQQQDSRHSNEVLGLGQTGMLNQVSKKTTNTNTIISFEYVLTKRLHSFIYCKLVFGQQQHWWRRRILTVSGG